MDEFNKLWALSRTAFKQQRTFDRVRQLAYGAITCLGRHTISGVITACGRQFLDWSSAYRVFGKNRINTEIFFDVARQGVLEELEPSQMIVAHMDDTIIKKTGKKVFGAAWRRDPLGPPFQTNFIWGQRFIQLSMALPDLEDNCQSRAIPIDFHHCPTIKKLSKDADSQQTQIFKEEQRIAKLSKQGSLRIEALRSKLDVEGAKARELVISVDGSYTNQTVIKSLPDRVTLIGRIRKDAKLYRLPGEQTGRGRKKVYGERLATPEQIRQSEDTPWQNVKAWAAGKSHDFNVKVVKDLRWRAAGMRTLQLVIIRPLAYRLTNSSRLLYRQPAYLTCTDNNLALEKLLQAYIWRWEIEVNLRDEKTILGCGQAQVRNPESVKNFPAFIAALYSFILLAAHRSCKKRDDSIILPRPKWYPAKILQRITTSEIINLFRGHLWMKPEDGNFSGFLEKEHKHKSLRNETNPLMAAILYTRK